MLTRHDVKQRLSRGWGERERTRSRFDQAEISTDFAVRVFTECTSTNTRRSARTEPDRLRRTRRTILQNRV